MKGMIQKNKSNKILKRDLHQHLTGTKNISSDKVEAVIRSLSESGYICEEDDFYSLSSY
jgi:hypothetical protein